jgi:hypothetical protein
MDPEHIPGDVPDQQASAPVSQTTQQTGDGIDWKARYQGLSKTLEAKNLELKGLMPQLEAKDGSLASLQAQMAQLQEQVAAKTQLEQALAEKDMQLARFKLFGEFPQFMPVMDKLNLQGSLEEQRAALEALAQLQGTQVKEQADTVVKEAMSGVTPTIKNTPELSLADRLEAARERAYELASSGKQKESEEALIEALELEAQLNDQQNGDRFGGRRDPFSRRI